MPPRLLLWSPSFLILPALSLSSSPFSSCVATSLISPSSEHVLVRSGQDSGCSEIPISAPLPANPATGLEEGETVGVAVSKDFADLEDDVEGLAGSRRSGRTVSAWLASEGRVLLRYDESNSEDEMIWSSARIMDSSGLIELVEKVGEAVAGIEGRERMRSSSVALEDAS